jgi:hypothetical protein
MTKLLKLFTASLLPLAGSHIEASAQHIKINLNRAAPHDYHLATVKSPKSLTHRRNLEQAQISLHQALLETSKVQQEKRKCSTPLAKPNLTKIPLGKEVSLALLLWIEAALDTKRTAASASPSLWWTVDKMAVAAMIGEVPAEETPEIGEVDRDQSPEAPVVSTTSLLPEDLTAYEKGVGLLPSVFGRYAVVISQTIYNLRKVGKKYFSIVRKATAEAEAASIAARFRQVQDQQPAYDEGVTRLHAVFGRYAIVIQQTISKLGRMEDSTIEERATAALEATVFLAQAEAYCYKREQLAREYMSLRLQAADGIVAAIAPGDNSSADVQYAEAVVQMLEETMRLFCDQDGDLSKGLESTEKSIKNCLEEEEKVERCLQAGADISLPLEQAVSYAKRARKSLLLRHQRVVIELEVKFTDLTQQSEAVETLPQRSVELAVAPEGDIYKENKETIIGLAKDFRVNRVEELAYRLLLLESRNRLLGELSQEQWEETAYLIQKERLVIMQLANLVYIQDSFSLDILQNLRSPQYVFEYRNEIMQKLQKNISRALAAAEPVEVDLDQSLLLESRMPNLKLTFTDQARASAFEEIEGLVQVSLRDQLEIGLVEQFRLLIVDAEVNVDADTLVQAEAEVLKIINKIKSMRRSLGLGYPKLDTDGDAAEAQNSVASANKGGTSGPGSSSSSSIIGF